MNNNIMNTTTANNTNEFKVWSGESFTSPVERNRPVLVMLRNGEIFKGNVGYGMAEIWGWLPKKEKPHDIVGYKELPICPMCNMETGRLHYAAGSPFPWCTHKSHTEI